VKKYKQFVIGVIVGAMLFSIAPVSAVIEEFILYRADYKLVINGVEFNDPEVPLMNYKGYTVGSVRKIFEAAGIPIIWNTELGQAEVTLSGNNEQTIDLEKWIPPIRFAKEGVKITLNDPIILEKNDIMIKILKSDLPKINETKIIQVNNEPVTIQNYNGITYFLREDLEALGLLP